MASTSSSSSSNPPPPASSSSNPPPPVGNVDGIAQTCWVKFRKKAIFALYTPLIVSLASGKLKDETFRQFEFAEGYADDNEAMHGIKELRMITRNKVDCFRREWRSDLVKDDAIPNPATSKCINFLLAIASGKIDGIKPFEKTKFSAYILGAFTSCMRLNAYIGKEVRELFFEHETNHRCKKWIESYSSDSFQDFCLQTEKVLDKLSVALSVEELGIIEGLYSQGIKHEIEFFLAQPLIQKAIVPLSGEHNLEERRLMIFSNFDLTCTCVDSASTLADLTIETAPESDQIPIENQFARMTLSDLRDNWKVIAKKYRDGYEQCIEKLLATEKAEKLNYEGLRKALEQLSDFEKEANLRVIKSGVLKGLKLENIRRAGELLKLQDGCMDFFKTIKKKNADVHVISYCWCGYYLIRSVFLTGGIDDLKVHANELEFEESLSTGGIMMKVQSPIDKVEAFDKILLESSGEGNDKKKALSVYIGEAVGDLLCLLKADVGIVLAPIESLISVASHFGVKFVPLFTGVVKKQRECVEVEGADSSSTWKGLSGILYTASSWAEIHAFVFGS
ncbi:PREDICTED: probable aminopyrimidine aminohydrolase, mitochondrial isoform X2 [Ipomoea nil]|uniref:probable aminopyrimidine aminohydrolase, mitochondrial isoform X2 n=1 Tax=Ipomoea nil TaxID=35883 RepID=UPI000900FDC0|nr:PREDICTED: probable aminopyrimidine aminohydrolase, mitochondrial isoform X2 [Ipomoea nil]